ncbi:MAG TPA: PAS domain-containing protein [Acidobacteriaceae bacterium]|nr:PAS domain-containing protein [Acidobacteriaceae bacterium]
MHTNPIDKGTLNELLDAALNVLEEGFVVLDAEALIEAWNPAATRITGFQRGEMLGRPLPEGFYEIDPDATGSEEEAGFRVESRIDRPERAVAVQMRHHRGHSLPAMLRLTPLRDALGRRFGTVVRFHPTEELDALPHGAIYEEEDLDSGAGHNVCNIEERLELEWRKWDERGAPFGLLWVLVDQAEMLLKTHGRDASEAMLAIVERTLSHALRPGEILGRWGHHEFLVICHERSADLLLLHARHLCELTHSADFRWWGDRVPLTVSVGCAQAVREEKLKTLMQRAQQGMERARLGGGNTVVLSEAETMPAATEDTAGSRKTFKQDGR